MEGHEFAQLILAIVIICAIAIPVISDTVSTSRVINTITGEVFAGANNVAYAVVHFPALAVNSFEKSTVDIKNNVTALTTAVGTRNLVLNPAFNTQTFNITIFAQKNAGENLELYVGTCDIGAINNSFTTFTKQDGTCLSGTTVLNFTNDGTDSNITNASLQYSYYNQSVAYSLGSDGYVTPKANGLFRIGYDYGSGSTFTTDALFAVMPVLFGVLLLVFVAGYLNK